MIRVFNQKPTVKVEAPKEPVKVETRGRKKKSTEPEKVEVAETVVNITEINPEEETIDGN